MSRTDAAQAGELMEALRRVRALLLAHVPEPPPTSVPGPAVCAGNAALPWILWLAGGIALLLAWQWPRLAGEESAGAAGVAGAFTALGLFTAGAVFQTRAVRVMRPAAAPPAAAVVASRTALTPETDPLQAFSLASPLAAVRERFGLSDFETRVLLLCAAAELDPDVPDLLRRLQDGGLRQPVFALAQRLFPDGAWDTPSENRPLLHWLMVEVRQQDGRPLAQSPLRMDDGLLQYLIGNPAPDARLAAYHIPFPPEAAAESGGVPVVTLTALAQQMTASAVVEALDAATRSFLENGFGGALPRIRPEARLQGGLAVSPDSDPAEREADALSEHALSRRREVTVAANGAPDLWIRRRQIV